LARRVNVEEPHKATLFADLVHLGIARAEPLLELELLPIDHDFVQRLQLGVQTSYQLPRFGFVQQLVFEIFFIKKYKNFFVKIGLYLGLSG
jgi:hypothetical protein